MTTLLDLQHEKDITQKDIVILYHADCSDGFGGAWAAYRKFGDDAAYISVSHQIPPPGGLKNKIIYMIDFTYLEPITKQLIADNKSVTSIDHHKTAEIVAKTTQDCRYALEHSGSVLAWKYFHPDKPVPQMLLIIEDSDIHKFTIPYSRELFAYIDSYQFDFNIWSKLIERFENKMNWPQLVKDGHLVLQHEQRLVSWTIQSNVNFVEFEGYKAPVVNSFILHANIAEELAKQYPPIGITWWQKDDALNVRLRSDGSVDVSEIAKKFGGGGHKAASGFSIPFEAGFPWKLVKD